MTRACLRPCLVLLALAAGCFRERASFTDGELLCGTGGACPSGMVCASDERCRFPGADAGTALGDAATECQAGARRCVAAGPEECSAAGVWREGPACAAGEHCEGGACVGACVAGAERCAAGGTAIERCDSTGRFVVAKTCTFTCVAAPAAACTGVCAPGSTRCGPDETPQTCGATGQWQDGSRCAGICADGRCQGECRPGDSRCSDGTHVQTCRADGFFAAATACAFVCSATTGGCAGECVPGTLTCDGTRAERCDDRGVFVLKEDCGSEPCTGGECRACAEGSTQCNAGVPQKCTGGVWVSTRGAPCEFVCDATLGCTGECDPGSSSCDGDVKKSCGPDGHFGTPRTCEHVCIGGECAGVCDPGTHRCNGSSSQTCNSVGEWSGDQTCGFGCDAASGLCQGCTPEPMSELCFAGACGVKTDRCGGKVTCPDCTGQGQTCGGGGVSGVCGCTADPATCQGHCGPTVNNCGATVECPACCTPRTAAEACAGKDCGTVPDGCGGQLSCWPAGTTSCPGTNQTCGGGGTDNVCGCTPTGTCGTRACGAVADGCGGQLACGTCSSTQTCTSAGQCVDVCVPLTREQACQGKSCGTVDNGCHTGEYSCWPAGTTTCSGTGQTCGGGGVDNVCGCTPKNNCGAKVCGTAPDGCGGTMTCGSCSDARTCAADQLSCACKSATQLCTQLGKDCGVPPTLDGCAVGPCGTCSDPKVCTSNVCTCEPQATFCSGKGCTPDGYTEGGCSYDCGACVDPMSCGGGGQPFQCGCTPECDGAVCGPSANGCGSCGSCGSLADCVDGQCEPKDCCDLGTCPKQCGAG